MARYFADLFYSGAASWADPCTHPLVTHATDLYPPWPNGLASVAFEHFPLLFHAKMMGGVAAGSTCDT